ncbi:MAG: proline dehydrogenase family protein [Fimbriimonadaceae bacterium]|nr:proline dehydrogenase family protein [Chitinophagales bacterium]
MNNPGRTKFFTSAANLSIKLHLPVKWMIKNTVYEQFCGGETLEETIPVLNKLEKFSIGAIIDYGVEGKENEEEFERTKNELINILQFAKGKKNIPFISCKVTGLTRFVLLEKINGDVVLSEDEEKEKQKLYERLRQVTQVATDANVGLFVDAEESWIQDAIDEIVFILSREFNKEKVVVFHTAQMYRHDRLAFCSKCLNDAKQHNYVCGIKLVRGAYMEKERKRAAEKNYASPIQPDKESTDKDYDAAIDFCLDNLEKISFCVATHNEKSNLHAATEMDKKYIPHNHPHISFSQLYGMSDQITYNLAKAGYNVSKYLPYGPVKDVIPYLIRRANENTSVSGQMSRELLLIDKEMKRRKV